MTVTPTLPRVEPEPASVPTTGPAPGWSPGQTTQVEAEADAVRGRVVDEPDEDEVLRLEIDACDDIVRSRRQALDWCAVMDPDGARHRRLEVVVASCDARLGRAEQGAARLREVRDWAETRGERLVRARAEHGLADLMRRGGEPDSAIEHAVVSLDLLGPGDPPHCHVAHHLALADALTVAGSAEDGLLHYEEALGLARTLEDPVLLLRVINNLAYAHVEVDRIDEALPLCEEIMALRGAGRRLPAYVVSTLADTYLAAGLVDRAESLLDDLDVVNPDTAPVDELAGIVLVRARIARLRGQPRTARRLLDRAVRDLDAQGASEVEVVALRLRAEVSAELGEWEVAYHQVRECHDLELRRSRAAAEDRVRMVQAMLEVTRARRESAALREMSYRDSLTGLLNRRFVDEHLGALLEATLGRGETCGLAFVDLDHFKAVNDTASHAVGDQVLRTVAEMLADCAEPIKDSMAARMGGEEFLVVLPATDHATAGWLLERVRARVEAHEWTGLGARVPVTVSVGLVFTPDCGTRRAEVLAAADRRLYAAKDAGRNRVVTAL